MAKEGVVSPKGSWKPAGSAFPPLAPPREGPVPVPAGKDGRWDRCRAGPTEATGRGTGWTVVQRAAEVGWSQPSTELRFLDT